MPFSPQAAAKSIVWVFTFLLGGGLFVYGTPKIEAKLWPVIDQQTVTIEANDRRPGIVCWTWHWNKLRHAFPLTTSWSIVVDGTAVAFPVVVIRERDGDVVRNPAPAPLGPGRNDLCAKIPTELDSLKKLVVKGQIAYQTTGFWTLWYDVPPVEVPPLPVSTGSNEGTRNAQPRLTTGAMIVAALATSLFGSRKIKRRSKRAQPATGAFELGSR